MSFLSGGQGQKYDVNSSSDSDEYTDSSSNSDSSEYGDEGSSSNTDFSDLSDFEDEKISSISDDDDEDITDSSDIDSSDYEFLLEDSKKNKKKTKKTKFGVNATLTLKKKVKNNDHKRRGGNPMLSSKNQHRHNVHKIKSAGQVNYIVEGSGQMKYEPTDLSFECVLSFKLSKSEITKGKFATCHISNEVMRQQVVSHIQRSNLSEYRELNGINETKESLLRNWIPNKVDIVNVYCVNAPSCKFGIRIENNNNNDIYNVHQNLMTGDQLLLMHTPQMSYPKTAVDVSHVLNGPGAGTYLMSGEECRNESCVPYNNKSVHGSGSFLNVKQGSKIHTVLNNCDSFTEYREENKDRFRIEVDKSGYIQCIPKYCIDECVEKINNDLEDKVINYNVCEQGMDFILCPLNSSDSDNWYFNCADPFYVKGSKTEILVTIAMSFSEAIYV